MQSLIILLGINALLFISCAEQQAESTPQPAIATSDGTIEQNSSPTATVPPDERVGAESPNNSLNSSFISNDSTTVISNENDSTLHNEKTTGTTEKKSKQKRLSPLNYHKGVNHAHVHRRGHGYGSTPSARQHDWLKSIGGNAIAITPFGFQRGAKSNQLVGFGPNDVPGTRDPSMRLEDMAAEIDSAHKRGLRVMLKPHIWSHDFWSGAEWHGSIDQTSAADHKTWWASYRKLILFYAEFAEEAGVDYYCIGTELLQMTTKYPSEWRALIAEVRSLYSGKLTYAAHWDREWRAMEFWDALDFIGIGAYFPLDVPDSASVDQLVEAWQPHRHKIDSIAQKFNRSIIFLETGYRPVAGTWREPWLYTGGTKDNAAQGRAFEALFRAFKNDRWFKGIYVWKTFTDPNAARREGEQMDFQFKGLPGEKVLKEWWKKR